MGRRRWIQLPNGDLVEVTKDHQATPRNHDSVLWNDRAYQDMGDPRFASRAEHREYMRRNGLTTMDDFKGDWAKSAEQRAKFYQGIDPSRREDVSRALHQTINRKRH